jgi:hypothetical protein
MCMLLTVGHRIVIDERRLSVRRIVARLVGNVELIESNSEVSECFVNVVDGR